MVCPGVLSFVVGAEGLFDPYGSILRRVTRGPDTRSRLKYEEILP